MNNTRKITYIGIGIALYVAVSMIVKIPIVNRIKLDLGYIVFALYLVHFGRTGTIVGVAGCVIANMMSGGSFPIAWAIGQTFIGLVLGTLYPKEEKLWKKILYAVLILAIGLILIKSVLEIAMFRLPVAAKLLSNSAAWIADLIPFVIGLFLAEKIKLR